MKHFAQHIASVTFRALLVIALIGTATAVYAHAILVSSAPRDNAVLKTPPKRVVLRFDSRIEKKVSQVTLLNSDNKKIALPSTSKANSSGPSNQLIVPLPPLKPGKYQLQYQVMATDGHLTPGAISFTITGGKTR